MVRRVAFAFLFTLLLGFIPPPSLGSNGMEKALTGYIVDEKGEPVGGVLVALIVPPYLHALTDDRGVFVLKTEEPLPSWELLIMDINYPAQYLSLPITQREMTLKLSPAAPVAKEKETLSPVLIEADEFSYEAEPEIYRATGKVEIDYQGDWMTAQEVELRKKADKIVAVGQVKVKSAAGDIMEGKKLEMKLSDKTGYLEQGEIFVRQTHFYLRGPRLEKRGEATYYGRWVEATTCDGENPDWRIKGEDLHITIDGYGTLKHGCFYAKNAPLLYAPYMIFPVKTKRQTGFLLPHRLAYSDQLGLDLGIPFFWAISEDKDATFYQRFMSQRGFQEGVEFRYAALKSHGTVYAEYLQDRKNLSETVGNMSRDWKEEKTRWALYVNQETYFREDLSLRVDIARVSDSFYFKDFTSYNYFLANFKQDRAHTFQKIDFYGNESLSYLESTVRLGKTWEKYNLTMLVKNIQDLSSTTDRNTLQKYPEVALMGIKQPLGKTPLWFDASGVYDYYYRVQGEKGHLADVSSAVYLPLNLWRHLKFNPFVGVRGLLWSRDDSLSAGERRTDHREIYLTGATLTTELSRSYRLSEKEDSTLKHTIIPEAFYLYSPAPTGGEVPNFAPAISAGSAMNNIYSQMFLYTSPLGSSSPLTGDFNLISYSLTNFLSLRQIKKGKVEQSDFLRWKLAQYYDLREARREGGKPWSDIIFELDVYPAKYVSVSARNRYDVYETRWREENYGVSLSDKRGDTASLAYRYTKDSVKEVNMNLKAVLEKSLDMRLNYRRDLINDRDLEKGVGIDYRRQCWSIGFDFGESMNDRVFTIRYSLLGL